MRSVATLRSLPLLLALAAPSCERTTPTTDATVDPSDTPSRPKVDDERPTPAADPTHPLELVPARARAMLMAKSPQRLAQIWERDQFVGRFPAAYAELVEEMKREVGHDLFDPAGLAAARPGRRIDRVVDWIHRHLDLRGGPQHRREHPGQRRRSVELPCAVGAILKGTRNHRNVTDGCAAGACQPATQ